jgi:hypothetical protein
LLLLSTRPLHHLFQHYDISKPLELRGLNKRLLGFHRLGLSLAFQLNPALYPSPVASPLIDKALRDITALPDHISCCRVQFTRIQRKSSLFSLCPASSHLHRELCRPNCLASQLLKHSLVQ